MIRFVKWTMFGLLLLSLSGLFVMLGAENEARAINADEVAAQGRQETAQEGPSSEMVWQASQVTATATMTETVDWEALDALYPLSEAQREGLQENGFLILDDYAYDFLSEAHITQTLNGPDLAQFVTSDALLHVYHNVFNELLRTVEDEGLYDEVLALVQGLQELSQQAYTDLPDEESLAHQSTRHNLLYFSVARQLLETEFEPPAIVQGEVHSYTELILAHSEVQVYPGDDYTQYEPRGHYAGDEQREQYFRAMKWLSRRLFRIEDYQTPADGDLELVAAVLVAQWLEQNPTLQARWQKVYEVTQLLVGPADSITPPLVTHAISQTFGISFTLSLLEEPTQLERLRQELLTGEEYPTSEIIPVPTLPGQMPSRYIQFMGERYLPDAEVMQETTTPYVSGRSLPSGLDVMAALLGSEQAETLLAIEAQAYPELTTQLAALESQFGDYPESWWTRSVYNSWLFTLEPLLVSFEAEGYPAFMQSPAWERKSLNTALASWTQLRHDVILYGRQTYPPFGDRTGLGYLEPVPEFYQRLRNLCIQTANTLQPYNLLPEIYATRLAELAALLENFEGYAQKIRQGQALTTEEQNDIHSFALWLDIFFSNPALPEKVPILVADVATDASSGQILHEGVGRFQPIVILYNEPDGTTRIGVGLVMSHYEGAWPQFERLTDEEWEAWLKSQKPPTRPEWVRDLLASQQSLGGETWHLYLPLITD